MLNPPPFAHCNLLTPRPSGSGVAPFFPVPTTPAGTHLPFHLFLFCTRTTLLLPIALAYFLVFSWLPIGSLGKKAVLWLILGIPGIWWIDIQVDGVKRGSLAKQHSSRVPQPGSIIASSFTSPIDALYLAAIFDPIFTASFPNTRKVQRISLLDAMLGALLPPQTSPPPNAQLLDLSSLLAQNPDRCVVVFPETTTTNGRGILPFSPSLLSAPPKAKIFPVSLRYTPADITTPLPHTYFSFLWNLCSKPTHCIRVRIAECTYNVSASSPSSPPHRTLESARRNSYETNFLDVLAEQDLQRTGADVDADEVDGLEAEERKVLDRIAEALARLGRVKRVGLGVDEKIGFVRAWTRKKR
ncbi:Lysophosphatidic acid:oleoyl-CoA acyltransferase 1 [Elasticomyces elasticus]|nr:Lysophosphatidic acid:oleoyl-CoA acyltransferase 1 [Elasticomyces elasticus]